MAERSVVVASKDGLHARPAALFVKAATEQPVKVQIRKENGDPVAADSILGLMTLGVKCGDTVILSTPGDTPEDGDTLATLGDLLEAADL